MTQEDKQKEKTEEIRQAIKEIISDFEKMPEHAKLQPLNNYDYYAIICLLDTVIDHFFCSSSTDLSKES